MTGRLYNNDLQVNDAVTTTNSGEGIGIGTSEAVVITTEQDTVTFTDCCAIFLCRGGKVIELGCDDAVTAVY